MFKEGDAVLNSVFDCLIKKCEFESNLTLGSYSYVSSR